MSEMDGVLSPQWPAPVAPRQEPEVPTPAEVAYMALNGHSGRVFAVVRRLPAARLPEYAPPVVLRQGVVGGLEALRSVPSADRGRQQIVAVVEDLVDRHLEVARGAPSRDLLRSLLDWSRFLFGEARLREAEAAVDRALEFSEEFPDLHGRVVLEKAACLAARGDHGAAYAALDAVFSRWDLVAERDVVPEVALALGRAALLTGRVPEFKRSLFRGLRTFYVGGPPRRAIFDLLRRAHRGSLRLLAGPAARSDKLAFAAHWAGFRLADLVPPARRKVERAFLAGLYAGRYVLGAPRVRAAERTSAPPLVTRAMGGIGDLLMMTPALHALRLRLGSAVRLAIPRRYFPLFEGNDDVELVDIHGPLQPQRAPAWFNFTDCPAARSESLASPRIRRNRIEIFARALGVRGRALRRMDRRPRYFVSESERAERDAFFEARGLAGRAVVGIQLRAYESYRDYPHMAALVHLLACEYPVLVFTDRREPGLDWPGVVKVEGRPLREAFALASGCSVLVSPDSAFLHLAAALGLPAVALSGPTDGRVRVSDYPLARALDARRSLPCVPCWRNEEIPCALTGARASVCMGEIPPAAVALAVREVLAAARARDRG